jgi:hypothetical protein
MQVFHVAHRRRAHQGTVATQDILQNLADDHNCKGNDNDKDWLDLEVWIGKESPPFQYWSIVLELELPLNVNVRFQTIILHYVLDALTELAR